MFPSTHSRYSGSELSVAEAKQSTQSVALEGTHVEMPDDMSFSVFRSEGFAPYKLVRAPVRAPMRPAFDDAPPFKGRSRAARAEPAWNFHAEC